MIKEFREAFKRHINFPKTKLDYWTFRKLRALKSRAVGNKGWDEYFRYLTRDASLSPSIHERVQEGTQQTLLQDWMENFANNLPFIRYGSLAQLMYPENYRQQTMADLAVLSPLLETEPEYADAKGEVTEKNGVKVKNAPAGSVVVVGRGPSLFQHGHLEMLADAQQKGEYTGIVVASDGGLIPCLESGVKVHTVVTVDGAPVIKKYFDHPLVREHGSEINWILSVTTHHDVYQAGVAAGLKAYWFNPMFDDWRQNESWTRLQRLLSRTDRYIRGVPAANSGGNCLTADTIVLGNSHIFQIDQALIGDSIWTFNPEKMEMEKTRITQIIPQGINNVFELRTNTRSIKATAEHRFLVLSEEKPLFHKLSAFAKKEIKSQRKKLGISRKTLLEYCGINSIHTFKGIQSKGKRIQHDKLLLLLDCLKIPFSKEIIEDTKTHGRTQRKLIWKPLRDIGIGDRILILREDPETAHSPFTVENFGETTDNFMRIVGAFIGDGWLRIRKKGGQISFAFPNGDKSREKYINLLEKTFKSTVNSDQTQIHIYSKKLALMFSTIGLHKKATEKTIPEWVFSLPHSQKKAFVEGLIDSDGHVTDKGEICFEFANRKLVEQLKILLICLGLRVDNVYCHTRKKIKLNGHIYHNAKSWRIRVTTHKRKRRNTRKYASPRDHREQLGLPHTLALDLVQSIEPLGKQEVFDISVESNENFIANGVVSHNSGASAWVMAMDLFKRAPVALIGIDFGYPEGTPLDKTQYYSNILKLAKGDVKIIKEAYKEFYHPTFKTKAYVDLVFYHYRQAFLSMQDTTDMWYTMYGGTINATEGGTLFGPGITCMTFKEFLEKNKK